MRKLFGPDNHVPEHCCAYALHLTAVHIKLLVDAVRFQGKDQMSSEDKRTSNDTPADDDEAESVDGMEDTSVEKQSPQAARCRRGLYGSPAIHAVGC